MRAQPQPASETLAPRMSMPGSNKPLLPDYGAIALIRRLLTEQGMGHWKRYVAALILMGIVAACTALSAYLIGSVINAAYVSRSFSAIVALGAATIVLFTVKGFATYGQAVIMSRIGNRIIAENQRRMFAKLLTQNLAFYADRHSSEFIARLTTGANSATYVLGLLINAVGRDALQLVGLVTVMFVTDPLLSLFSFVVVPPAMLMLRKLMRRIYAIDH